MELLAILLSADTVSRSYDEAVDIRPEVSDARFWNCIPKHVALQSILRLKVHWSWSSKPCSLLIGQDITRR